ncbi:hypothetical protein [Actinomadura madurae]|nr:hypothetical protein [Actinomadura madurae]SPT56654.1 Uncharacterised protein [Actinomadura madurae]
MQSSEVVMNEDVLLRDLEGQIGLVGTSGLQRLQQTITRRLSAERQG